MTHQAPPENLPASSQDLGSGKCAPGQGLRLAEIENFIAACARRVCGLMNANTYPEKIEHHFPHTLLLARCLLMHNIPCSLQTRRYESSGDEPVRVWALGIGGDVVSVYGGRDWDSVRLSIARE